MCSVLEPKTVSEKLRRTVLIGTKDRAIIFQLVCDKWETLPRTSAGDHDRSDLCKLLRNFGMDSEADELTARS
jgi:hypothetical protein